MTVHAFPRKTGLDDHKNTARGERRFTINPLSWYYVSGRKKERKGNFYLGCWTILAKRNHEQC